MSERRCENCQYAVPPFEGHLECHRYPPKCEWDSEGERFALWPPVKADDWCGEFIHKDDLTMQKRVTIGPNGERGFAVGDVRLPVGWRFAE